jgi:hypothetical protein
MISQHSTNPGYADLVRDLYQVIKHNYAADNRDEYIFPSNFFQVLWKYYSFPFSEQLNIYYSAIVITLIRHFYDKCICIVNQNFYFFLKYTFQNNKPCAFNFKPFLENLKLNSQSEKVKARESSWKILVFTFLWSYCCYLLIFSQKYDYFFNPYDIWNGKDAFNSSRTADF